jgi:hypothetical protein
LQQLREMILAFMNCDSMRRELQRDT